MKDGDGEERGKLQGKEDVDGENENTHRHWIRNDRQTG